MAKDKNFQYYVEGQDEQKLLSVLKTELRCIRPGKIQVYNVVEKKLKSAYLMSLKMGTTVVFVFDTDTGKTDTLRENIRMVCKSPNVDRVICVMQVCNLEEELIRACEIRQIKELTGSKTNSGYKHDLIVMSNLATKLKDKGFSVEKMWKKQPPDAFAGIENKGEEIKA